MAIGDKSELKSEIRKLINKRSIAIAKNKRFTVYWLNNKIARLEQKIKDQ